MILRLSTKFKKDLKRYQNQSSKIEALRVVLKHLKQNGSVPLEYRPHMLSGNYKGFMECHIKDDFLLIWIDEARNTIKLVRLGTHHELFGK
ncbi:MAG: type II toxin-antitoxin system YafQ family toxin [Prevotella sp.]|nr:type II toxin-antitoxin system YafQ family toxin [Prevotella sp.]